MQCGRLPGRGRVRRDHHLAYRAAANPLVELSDLEVLRIDAVDRRYSYGGASVK
jgi:hypothetical protein